ncbi:MAG: hypothetical protein LBR73_02205 [Oscillospiraceae bacterium]|jgi:hypothetical protein|nr:hypothetical protein [Oscillospiraceae bacterium]
MRGESKLYNTEKYPPRCAYCRKGAPAPGGTIVLCPQRGVMLPDSACKKYKYDPLKRLPEKTPALPAFSPEDFRL